MYNRSAVNVNESNVSNQDDTTNDTDVIGANVAHDDAGTGGNDESKKNEDVGGKDTVDID